MQIAADDIALLTDEERRLSITYRLRPHCAGKRCRVIAAIILIVLLIIIGIVVFGVVFGIKNKSAKSNSVKAMDIPNPSLNEYIKAMDIPNPSLNRDITVMDILNPSLNRDIAAMDILNPSLNENIKAMDIPNPSLNASCFCPLNANSATDHLELNTTVDPCEDFFSYACGGFFKKHQLGENQSTEDAFSVLFHDNMRVIRHVLQNATSVYPQSSSIRKTTQIYNSCLNTAAINNRGNAPLLTLIEKYGGWTVAGKGLNSWTVQEKMGRIQRDLNVHSLLFASVGTDHADSTRSILKIGTSHLGIWIWNYYQDTEDPEVLKIQHAYKTYMTTIARLLGGGSDSEKKMMRIYNFERDLASRRDRDKPFSDDLVQSLGQYYYSRRSLDFSLDKTIADFCSDSNFNQTFILDFLNTAFLHQGITFDSREKVYYGGHLIFRHIASKYHTTSHDIIKDYIMWRVVSRYVWSMPDLFVEAKLEFYKALRGTRKSRHQRWSFCIDEMLTPMDMTLGRMHVDAHYDEATKSTVQEMTTLIREAFINNLNSADWMDSATKEAAREKANAIKEDVGYPPYIKNDTKLDEHYSKLTVSDDYFENKIAMNKMLVQKNFGMLRHPVSKDLWPEKNPAEVNAFYYKHKNTIVFLAGILQTPFYTKNYPKYLNYGSLATVIGHEITHGFDNSGRLYDKNGNFNDWWSEESEANFKSKSDCLVHQYGNYKVFGKKIKGKKTLGENIADNGGLKLAYEAYQSWVKANGRENPLPDLSMSVDQLFFIGFAMTHCAVYKKTAALYQREIDSHSYDKYRVIGSLSNFNKFAKAFNCPIGSGMNPVKKCSVW
ncbi:unnamed protein product [Porites lobata]|uniref:Uncharacterized protein n=1 Tax=Porites lobata TaxID=104759 RepID=A0ABN8QCT5_9CNID|nr:unnamed protein product [Porites lobata]